MKHVMNPFRYANLLLSCLSGSAELIQIEQVVLCVSEERMEAAYDRVVERLSSQHRTILNAQRCVVDGAWRKVDTAERGQRVAKRKVRSA